MKWLAITHYDWECVQPKRRKNREEKTKVFFLCFLYNLFFISIYFFFLLSLIVEKEQLKLKILNTELLEEKYAPRKKFKEIEQVFWSYQVHFHYMLCCAVLCCAVLCCAVLCCAVLCCAVLCCAVLCWVLYRNTFLVD
jgi:hypothetical protein